MSIMNKLTASYLAGLIDGEGSIEIQKRKRNECQNSIYYNPRTRITLTEKNLIYWLKNSFGGCIYNRKGKGNNKNSYEWCLSYGSNKKFLEKVLPYLKIKKRHAELVRRFYKTIIKFSYQLKENKRATKKGIIGKHKQLIPEVLETREKLFQEIKQLNKKGFAR